WQKQFYTATQNAVICIGGRGSGKTTAADVTMLVEAVLYPDYYCICPAPTLKQSRDNFKKIKQLIRGTLYEKRFEVKFLSHPELTIQITAWHNGKSYISEIKFYTVTNYETFRGIEADRIYADQAELFDNIIDGTSNVFTTLVACLRGFVPSVGRDRIAKSWWIANASHNFGMYKLRDRALDEPDKYL
ncbi:MAG TPA: hypothetical protein PLZ51_25050, partial [Aggregatilineales bacterium]|nr:hypothetical protein [Aggregatilineales bacterium]